MVKSWTTEASEVVVDSPWLRVRQDRCRRGDGMIIEPYFVLEYSSWCSVVALTPTMQTIMVEEYRHAAGVVVRGFPGGMIADGEAPETAIARELLEETGYQPGELYLVGDSWTNPASHNNRVYNFMALDCVPVAAQCLDATEDIDTVLVDFADVRRPGFLVHAMHTANLWFAEHKLRELGRIEK